MSYSFQGGVYLETNREKTNLKPVFPFDRAASVKLPLSGTGVEFAPTAAPGDHVCAGQIIGECADLPGFPLRATISGTVTEIGDGVLPDGRFIPCIAIENDFSEEIEHLTLAMDWQMMSPDEICAVIASAGIFGKSGPTFARINAMRERADTLIIDGIDGEPYASAAYRTLCDDAEDIVEGIHVLMRVFGRIRCIVAATDEGSEAADALRAAIAADKRIRVMHLRDKYPQNDEKLLIKTITGREAHDLADTAVLVLGVQEAAAIGRALRDAMPDLTRIVTVSGDAIANPKTVRTPLGTAWYELVRVCGGYGETPRKIVIGGVMRADATFTDNIPLLPGVESFTALCADAPGTAGTCIHCGRCAAVCPYGLMPSYVRFFLECGSIDRLAQLGVEDCTGCGACSYVCPAHIALATAMRRAQSMAGQEQE